MSASLSSRTAVMATPSFVGVPLEVRQIIYGFVLGKTLSAPMYAPAITGDLDTYVATTPQLAFTVICSAVENNFCSLLCVNKAVSREVVHYAVTNCNFIIREIEQTMEISTIIPAVASLVRNPKRVTRDRFASVIHNLTIEVNQVGHQHALRNYVYTTEGQPRLEYFAYDLSKYNFPGMNVTFKVEWNSVAGKFLRDYDEPAIQRLKTKFLDTLRPAYNLDGGHRNVDLHYYAPELETGELSRVF